MKDKSDVLFALTDAANAAIDAGMLEVARETQAIARRLRSDEYKCEPANVMQDGENNQVFKVDMADNSWHARGELPPVGVECEYTSQFFGTKKHSNGTCKVIAYYQNKVWVDIVGYSEFVISLDVIKFRPIKSERELLIDVIASAGGLSDGMLADAILAAGFRAPE